MKNYQVQFLLCEEFISSLKMILRKLSFFKNVLNIVANGILETWDSGRETHLSGPDQGPSTWVLSPGTRDLGPIARNHDPGPGNFHLGPGTQDHICKRLLYRNQTIDLLGLIFI